MDIIRCLVSLFLVLYGWSSAELNADSDMQTKQPFIQLIGKKIQKHADGEVEMRVFYEHTIPFKAFCRAYSPLYQVPVSVEDKSSVMTRPVRDGVKITEFVLRLQSADLASYSSLSAYMRSNVDDHIIFMSIDLENEIPNENVKEEYEGKAFQVLEAPPGLLKLYEGQDVSIAFIVKIDLNLSDSPRQPSFAYIAKYDMTSRVVLDASDSVLFNEEGYGHGTISSNVETKLEIITNDSFALKINIQTFKAIENVGTYCMHLGSSMNILKSMIFAATCTDIVPANQELSNALIKNKLNIETCTRQNQGSPSTKIALYENKAECIICSVIGIRNPDIRLYHQKDDMSRNEVQITFSQDASNFIAYAGYTILEPKATVSGIYTCVAFNEESSLVASATVVLTTPLEVNLETNGWDYKRNGITAQCSADGPEGIHTYYALKTRTNRQPVNEDEGDIHLESGSTVCYDIQIGTTDTVDGNQNIHLDFQFRSDAPSCTWKEYSANLTYHILGCVAETSVVRRFEDFQTQTIENFYGPCCIWTS